MRFFDPANAATVMMAVRHLLSAIGLFLVQQGYFDEELSDAIVGAIMSLLGLYWAWMNERGYKITVQKKTPENETEKSNE